MKLADVINLLNISKTYVRRLYDKGIIRGIKLDNGMYDYNEEDIEKILDDRIIVLINPKTLTIEKTYNNINDVTTDLKIPKVEIQKCIDNDINECGSYILKYKNDATEDNIKVYSDKYNNIPDDQKIVLIDPKTQTIHKIYNNMNEVIFDLKVAERSLKVAKRSLNDCLTHNANTSGGYILKYTKDATYDNIQLYSSMHNNALDGTKKCRDCNKWVKCEDVKKSSCVSCVFKKRNDYNNSHRGFFVNMVANMKNKANIRDEQGKESGICTIDADFLRQMYENQKGLCYYSNIKMTTTPGSDWQASPERLNNNVGYTKENTKLVCLEFNIGGFNQWNKSKIILLKTLRNEVIDISNLNKKIKNAKNNTKKEKQEHLNRKIESINDIVHYECNKCKEFKISSEFKINYRNKSEPFTFCKECVKNHNIMYNNTFKGFLVKRLQIAKCSAKKRKIIKIEKVHMANLI